MHVLSTPPAFILSQDQTLHKNVSAETGREKPKPNQKQTNQHKMLDWQNPKITKVQQPTPNPTGQKGGWPKNIRETCSTTPHAHRTKQMTRSIIGIQPRHHRHTPKQGTHHTVHKTRQANTPTQQKYIGTLSSSQTTPAHLPTRTKHGPSRKKRLRQKLHNQPTKSQTHVKPRLTRT